MSVNEDQFEDDQLSEELKEGDPCPLCGSALVLRHSSRGDFLGCSNYPSCSFVQKVSLRRKVTVIRPLEAFCPRCGSRLAVKKGRFGLFIGCLNYPSCDFFHTVASDGEVDCPVCKKGKLVERSARSGHIFYGCSNYPECSFCVPGKPLVQSCPRCSFPLMYEKITKKGTAVLCGNSLCPSRKARKRKFKERLSDEELQKKLSDNR